MRVCVRIWNAYIITRTYFPRWDGANVIATAALADGDRGDGIAFDFMLDEMAGLR